MNGVVKLPASEELLVDVPAEQLVAANLGKEVTVEKKDVDAAKSFFH